MLRNLKSRNWSSKEQSVPCLLENIERQSVHFYFCTIWQRRLQWHTDKKINVDTWKAVHSGKWNRRGWLISCVANESHSRALKKKNSGETTTITKDGLAQLKGIQSYWSELKAPNYITPQQWLQWRGKTQEGKTLTFLCYMWCHWWGIPGCVWE